MPLTDDVGAHRPGRRPVLSRLLHAATQRTMPGHLTDMVRQAVQEPPNIAGAEATVIGMRSVDQMKVVPFPVR